MSEITMQDVRLMAGEGKLSAHDVLAACNAVLRLRKDGWRPIETAPKDGTNIILADDSDPQMSVIGFWQSGSWLVDWDHEHFNDPKRWMPLPEAPK